MAAFVADFKANGVAFIQNVMNLNKADTGGIGGLDGLDGLDADGGPEQANNQPRTVLSLLR